MTIHTVIGFKHHTYKRDNVEKEAYFLFTQYDDPSASGQPCESNFIRPDMFRAAGVGIGDKILIFKNRGFVQNIHVLEKV